MTQIRGISSRIEHDVAELPEGRIVMSLPRSGRINAAQIVAELGDQRPLRVRRPSRSRGGLSHVRSARVTQRWRAQVRRCTTGAFSGATVHIVGGSDQTWRGVPLPINLAFAGRPDCDVWVAPEVFHPVQAMNAEVRYSLAVPPDPMFLGITLFHQFFADGPMLSSATNAYAVEIYR